MIAIKGMGMPSCCLWDCPLAREDGGACQLADVRTSDNGRPKDCPLVEIVTCKDCKHRDKVHPSWLSNKKEEVYFCTLQSDEYCYEVEDDFYCKDGERRE